jgi:hypothetical protein
MRFLLGEQMIDLILPVVKKVVWWYHHNPHRPTILVQPDTLPSLCLADNLALFALAHLWRDSKKWGKPTVKG